MIKLLVIADDFTGALDTGVQFAGKGMTTKVLNYFPEDEETLKRLQAEVLVIDAQTRHLEGQEAYRKVFDVVKRAGDAGVPYIYKKTDYPGTAGHGPDHSRRSPLCGRGTYSRERIRTRSF